MLSACLWCSDVFSLSASVSSAVQPPPALHSLWNATALLLQIIAFFKNPPHFIHVDFNVEFINVMPFQRYD